MTLAERLFAHSTAPSLFACWIWHGATVKARGGKRYGKIHVKGKSRLVHRVAYELFVGKLLAEADHLCETTLCWNPAHLRDATTSQNRWNHVRDPQTQRYAKREAEEMERYLDELEPAI